MDNDANEKASAVEDSISQTAKLNLASTLHSETDEKDSVVTSSEAAKKSEIPSTSMPSGPKTRQVFQTLR